MKKYFIKLICVFIPSKRIRNRIRGKSNKIVPSVKMGYQSYFGEGTVFGKGSEVRKLLLNFG